MMLAPPVDGKDAANAVPESTMMILGGCQLDEKTRRSSCDAERQDVNLNGVCASQCQNGATITSMGVCECTKDFTGTLCDKPLSTGNVDCPKDCSGHGTCTGGRCQCDATYGGADCTQLPVQSRVLMTAWPRAMQYCTGIRHTTVRLQGPISWCHLLRAVLLSQL